MRSSFRMYLLFFVGMTSLFGACSKGGDAGGSNNNNNGNGNTTTYTAPTLSTTDTWVYMTSTNLAGLYANNYVGTNQLRPTDRKWISMNTGTSGLYANSFKNTPAIYTASNGLRDSTRSSMSFSFENTDKNTRFISESLNPGGREVISISIGNFNRAPGPGTYTITHDIPNDYKIQDISYDVYKSSGQKYDSTSSAASSFLPSGQYSTFTVTSMTFFVSDPSKDVYKMSGTGTFLLPHIFSNTGGVINSTTFTLNCVFNNVPINFIK